MNKKLERLLQLHTWSRSEYVVWTDELEHEYESLIDLISTEIDRVVEYPTIWGGEE